MARNNDGTRISLLRQSLEWGPFRTDEFDPLVKRVELFGKRLEFVENDSGGPGGAVDSVNGLTGIVVLTTTEIAEGTRLYFTTARARQSISVSPPLSYNSGTGLVAITQASGAADGYLSSVDWAAFNAKEGGITAGTTAQYWRGDKSWQTLNTTVVPEGANLYLTTTRVRDAISASAPVSFSGGVISMTQANGSTNGWLSAVDWSTFNAKEGALAPGTTDQYYRGDKTWQTLNTSVVPEGTNLYHTTTRVRDLFSATAPLSYAAGVYSMTQSSTSVSGWLSSTDWNTFNDKQSSTANLNSLSSLTGIGIVVRHVIDGFITRSLVAGSNMVITNPTGAAGDITIALSADPSVTTLTTSSTVTSGGQVIAPLGSLSAPSYTFFGDLNTGIYSTAADSLSIVSGGVAAVTVRASSVTSGRVHFPVITTGTIARFGTDHSVFVMDTPPQVGFNVYSNSGYKFGHTGYGAVTHFDPADGSESLYFTNDSGLADASATILTRGRFAASRFGVVVAGGDGSVDGFSSKVPATGSALTVERGDLYLRSPVSHGDYTRNVVWQNYNQNVWSLGTLVSVNDIAMRYGSVEMMRFGVNSVEFSYPPALSQAEPTYKFQVNSNGLPGDSLFPAASVRLMANNAGTQSSGPDDFSNIPTGGDVILNAGGVVDNGTYYDNGTLAGSVYLNGGFSSYSNDYGRIYFGAVDPSQTPVASYGYIGINSYLSGFLSLGSYLVAAYVSATTSISTLHSLSLNTAGTVTSPAITNSADPNTGIYWTATDQLNVTTGGVLRSTWSTTGITNTIPIVNPLGAVGAPSYTFSADTNTGIYSPGADQVGIATNGVLRSTWSTTAITNTIPIVNPLGAVGTPSYTFVADTNTGIYSPGADQVGVTTGGVLRSTWSTTGITNTIPIVNPLGAVGTPSYTFVSDTDTGIYSPSAGSMAFATNGSNVMVIGNTSSTSFVSITATSALSAGPPYVNGLEVGINQANALAPRGAMVTTTFTASSLAVTTYQTYGVHATANHTQNVSAASPGAVREVYGGQFVANNTGTDLLNATTRNTYGVLGSAIADTNGVSTTYGVYANAIGGDTNWGVYSASGNNYFFGNVSIADTAPPSYSTLHVADASGPIVSVEENGTNLGYMAQSSTVTIFGAGGTFSFKAGVTSGSGPIASGTTLGTWSTTNLAVSTAQTVSYTTATLGVSASSIASNSYAATFTGDNAASNITGGRVLNAVYTRSFGDTGSSFTYINTAMTIEYTDSQSSTATSGVCLDLGTGLSVVVSHTGVTLGTTMNKNAIGVYSFVTNSGAVVFGSSTRECYGFYGVAVGSTDGNSMCVGVFSNATGADTNIGVLADATGGTTSICFAANQLGTATAPSYSFFADQNTGIYSSGADTLNITTGGTLRVTVNSNGIQATGYRSADNTAGVTGSFPDNNNVTRNFKNGIYVG